MSNFSVNNVFIVKEILDKRIKRGRIEYLIKWKEFPDSDNTWEPIDNIMDGCYHLIKQFEDNRLNQNFLNNQNNDSSTKGSEQLSIDAEDQPPVIDDMSDFMMNLTIDSNAEEIDRPIPELDYIGSDNGLTSDPIIESIGEKKSSKGVSKEPIFVCNEWPNGVDPEEILSIGLDKEYNIYFRIKWKMDFQAHWVSAKEANIRCPQLVIKYYEKRIEFFT